MTVFALGLAAIILVGGTTVFAYDRVARSTTWHTILRRWCR